MEHLQSAKILLGITGSIAAYKIPLLVRLLRQHGAQVRVAMTSAAREFVTPLVLGNLAGEPVATDMFEPNVQERGSWHIHWAHWADVMLIAPCSADTLAALAHGLCRSVVEALALALPQATPLLVAPAMDTTMWLHPATQRNVRQLRDDGAIVIDPEEGELASGLWGIGRMPEVEHLVEHLCVVLARKEKAPPPQTSRTIVSEELLLKPLRSLNDAVESDRLTAAIELARLQVGKDYRLDGATVLITAGPTREALDAVRFISNRSSGAMGYALAKAARQRGARVVLISGPVRIAPPEGVELVSVESAQQMLEAVQRYRGTWDIAIGAAAIADYTPAVTHEGKIKKHEKGERWTLELVRTPDILADLASTKRQGQIVVGFALEEAAHLDQGIEKLQAKGCDIIVLNALDAPNSGFESSMNTITVVTVTPAGIERLSYPPAPKQVCAEYILNHVAQRYHKYTAIG